MFEVKQNQRSWVPVRLFNTSNGSGSVGVASGSVTVLIVKADTSEAAYTVGSGAWIEHTTAPATGSGLYQLNLKTTDTDTSGSLVYVVQSTLSRVYIGSIKVVANEEADTFTALAAASSSLGQQLTRIRQATEGRWKIHTSGPDVNRMVFYEVDGTTVMFKLDLKDAAGAPTTSSPFERVPV